ncbi:rhomboid family intramembrane serine protease [Aestuariispira insulae]|uniref:Rhomboid family protein n=1 Tax=Aestuariispira insulae TaxID=1461337 RepID=A0A3D9H3Y7_9PROT|nr:rhomboid family intramembrane serine protease [Aestuariispira insulae]RED44213.1 rhomboid family protein [Aestuariispira insulae]
MERIKSLKIALFPLLALWAVEIVNLILNHSLVQWGILPRQLSGLIGIPLSPWIHGDLYHALSNSLPLLILGIAVALDGRKHFIRLTAFVTLVGGAMIWLIGRSAYHIGASSLVFGFFGYLLAKGMFHRDFRSIAIALAVIFFYGGLVYGLLPLASHISFEGHFFGMAAGAVYAYLTRRREDSKS